MDEITKLKIIYHKSQNFLHHSQHQPDAHFFTALNRLDPSRKKAFYIKTGKNFWVSELYFSNVTVFQVLTPKQKFCLNTIPMNGKYNANGMGNIQQLVGRWGYVIILQHKTTLEKQLTKMQNLTFYNTNLDFLYIIAKFSLTNFCLISLNHLDPTIKK